MEEFIKEFAKIFIDIIKYVATAIIISSILGGLQDHRVVYAVGLGVIMLCALTSYILYRILDSIKNKEKNKRRD